VAKCERLDVCPFFNDQMAYTPFLASLVKKQYCLGDPARCARLVVLLAKGVAAVPDDLYPTQEERAEKILKG
jgi:hypothetical protein